MLKPTGEEDTQVKGGAYFIIVYRKVFEMKELLLDLEIWVDLEGNPWRGGKSG